eukprot:5791687-Pyramimonas_sp.AAC.1
MKQALQHQSPQLAVRSTAEAAKSEAGVVRQADGARRAASRRHEPLVTQVLRLRSQLQNAEQKEQAAALELARAEDAKRKAAQALARAEGLHTA